MNSLPTENNNEKVQILFVCMGNICRSPTAEGLARDFIRANGLQQLVTVDSAGTHAYHVGEPPDERSQQAAMRRSVDISDLRARRLIEDDFERFDYLFAMDQRNMDAMMEKCPQPHADKLEKIMNYSSLDVTTDVPDPYYGGRFGFEQVLDLLEDSIEELFAHLILQHQWQTSRTTGNGEMMNHV